MAGKIDTPQEVEVWFLLPAVRRQLMVSMAAQGLKQKEIAQILNLTDAAVSQYVHNKRASRVTFPEPILKQIEQSAQSLIEKKGSLQQELQRIMQSMWNTKFICGVCRSQTGAGNSCSVCYS